MKNGKWQVCICGAIKCGTEYLLVKRSSSDEDCAGFWEMPSGKLELGETVEEGLKREVLEETGIDITPYDKQIVGISEYSSDKPDGTRYSVQLNYVVPVPTKVPVNLSAEHTDWVWATRDSDYIDEFIAEIISAIESREEEKNGKNNRM